MEVNTTILFYGIANTYYELGNFDKAVSAINKSLLVSLVKKSLNQMRTTGRFLTE